MPKIIANDVLDERPRIKTPCVVRWFHVRVEIRPMRDTKIDKAQSLASDCFFRDMVSLSGESIRINGEVFNHI
jgi:hypothetical protein